MCYCCCGGAAHLPMMSTGPDEITASYEIGVGDRVLAASGPDLKSWTPLPVAFSAGVGPDPAYPLIEIRYGDEARPSSVAAAPNQPFLVPGAKLKRASRLIPGQDELVSPEGEPVPILEVHRDLPSRGLHRIATSAGPATEIAGHLLAANGVVCGDYALELADLEGAMPAVLAP
jgi:hypothetical protein